MPNVPHRRRQPPPGLGNNCGAPCSGNVCIGAEASFIADGVNPSSVKYVVVPFPDMIAALKAKQVDAISAVEPFLTGAESSDGAKEVVSSCAGPVADTPMSGYFATQSWAQQNPNTARAFQTALLKAQACANANPAAVQAILPSYTKVTAAAASHIPVNNYPSTLDPA